MSNQMELLAEVRVVSGKQVKKLRRQGLVPANMYGQNHPSVSLQVNGMALRKLLDRGGNNVILSLKVGNQLPVQAIIDQVQCDSASGETFHVNFHRIPASETLKTHVQLHFVNEAAAASLSGGMVQRSLSEVMVECLPADLPTSIQVDLSDLKEVGAVIRVGNLRVAPTVTILTDHNDVVAGIHHQVRVEKAEEVEEKTEAPAATSKTPARGGAERQQAS